MGIVEFLFGTPRPTYVTQASPNALDSLRSLLSGLSLDLFATSEPNYPKPKLEAPTPTPDPSCDPSQRPPRGR